VSADKGKQTETTAASKEAPKPAATFSFGGQSTAAPATGTLAGTATPTATKTPAPPSAAPAQPAAHAKPEPVPSMLENKTHGEIVQEMNKLLEARVTEFEKAAAEVRNWDKMLLQNAAQVR
jgi:hypothetical protein